MKITYYAYLTSETGETKLFCKGRDYEKVKAKFEGYRMRYLEKHEVWLGGFIQSFK